MSISDARSQLAEIEALIALSPNDPSLQALKDDLLQLIALEEQASSHEPSAVPVLPAPEQAGTSSLDLYAEADQNSPTNPDDYTAQGKFTSHATSIQSSLSEAPDISAFQPVIKASASRSADMSPNTTANVADLDATNTDPNEKTKKKKKKKEEDSEMKFELPPHLVPLDSDTPAQKLKKQRTAKALKSKFRERQKEMEADKKKNDWKSFAKGGKRKAVGGIVGSSIFSTEEGVNAKVGVVSGGGTRKMTEFSERGGNKRHKFL